MQANILVDANGNACLTDFGLAKALESSGTLTGTSTMRGTLRWMAPELLMNDGSDANAGQPTSASDMYATAMVIWEVSCITALWADRRANRLEALHGSRTI